MDIQRGVCKSRLPPNKGVTHSRHVKQSSPKTLEIELVQVFILKVFMYLQDFVIHE